MKSRLQVLPECLGASAVLFFVWFAFVCNVLDGEHSFAVFQDNEAFLAPVLSHMSGALRRGEWPFWMNTILGGIPLYNFTQLSPLYPLYFVGLPIFDSPIEAIRSMHLITLGHVLLFEVNAYILLRTCRLSRVASLAGAVLVVFNANTLGYAVWINIVAPYSWFPLYLAGLIRLLDTPRSTLSIVMALCAIVMLTLGSPAQPLIHAVFLTAVFVCFHALSLVRLNDTSRLRKGILSLCGVAAIALLLTSPVLLPTVTEFKDMIRWVGSFPPVYGNARIPFEAFLTDQLAVHDLPGVLFQLGGKRAVGSEFVGILPVILAIFAFSGRDRNWVLWPLIFVALYSLASATGSNLGLAYINHHLPLINKIREPSRFLFLFHFSVGIIAAIGIDRLGRTVEHSCSEHQDYRGLWSMCGATVVGLVVAIIFWQQAERHVVILVPLLVTMALLVITLLAVKRGWSSRGKLIVFAWAIAVIIVQWILVPWVAPPISSSDYLAGDMGSLDAALARVAEIDPQREYRIIFDGRIDKQQAAMLASYHGLRALNSYFNPAPRKQFEELYYHGPRSDNYFKVLGAKYLVCRECGTEALSGYTHLEDVAGYSIYEASTALPHTYIAHSIDGEFHDLGEFTSMISGIDLSGSPLFVESGAWQTDPGMQSEVTPACTQQTTRRELNRLEMVIKCDSSGVFVLNEFFTSAWKANIDGRKETILKVNGNQIGVPFSAGSHVIEFRYAPRILQVSLGLVVVGGVAFLFFLYFIRRIELSPQGKEDLLKETAT